MDRLYSDLKYEILKFVSYFDLDSILPCFNFTPSEATLIKQKIYNQRLTITQIFFDRRDPDYMYNKTQYIIEGKLHRIDGPAIEWDNGSNDWFINDKRHNPNGPAVENRDGSKEWWINSKLHRLDGPAIEYADGSKEWWVNNRKHRDNDLPAVERSNGTKEWWLHGRFIRQN